ncbi:MAG: Tn3 family transposase [Desulforhopalus sp.]|nr:Tn3 family transposase [Desulforhopalus sp.]
MEGSCFIKRHFQQTEFRVDTTAAADWNTCRRRALVWNTVKISEIIKGLRENGVIINNDTLSHVSPLPSAHIIPTGTYNFAA